MDSRHRYMATIVEDSFGCSAGMVDAVIGDQMGTPITTVAARALAAAAAAAAAVAATAAASAAAAGAAGAGAAAAAADVAAAGAGAAAALLLLLLLLLLRPPRRSCGRGVCAGVGKPNLSAEG